MRGLDLPRDVVWQAELTVIQLDSRARV